MDKRSRKSAAPTRVAIAVIVHSGRVLVGRRPAGVRLAGYWEFPGGKLEPEETPSQCVVREVREECGLEVRTNRALPAILRVDHDMTIELLPFLCHPEGSDKAHPPQVRATGTTQLQWVSIDRLREYHFPPANAQLIEEIERLFPECSDRGKSRQRAS